MTRQLRQPSPQCCARLIDPIAFNRDEEIHDAEAGAADRGQGRLLIGWAQKNPTVCRWTMSSCESAQSDPIIPSEFLIPMTCGADRRPNFTPVYTQGRTPMPGYFSVAINTGSPHVWESAVLCTVLRTRRPCRQMPPKTCSVCISRFQLTTSTRLGCSFLRFGNDFDCQGISDVPRTIS